MTATGSFLVILGIAQDAGHPQVGCTASCCESAWADPSLRHLPTSVAIVDGGRRWLLDATPALPEQVHRLDLAAPRAPGQPALDGVLLTHAHMGHYTGLVHLGREGLGMDRVPIYAMPRMAQMLVTAAPWELLFRADHARLVDASRPFVLGSVEVSTVLVPHRDEYSETVAYRLKGPTQTVLYLPDLDSWDDADLDALFDGVDVALVDGTFFRDGELVGRDMSQVPHPRVVDTMARFARWPAERRAGLHFIHLNHTNPLLDPQSPAAVAVRTAGYAIASEGQIIPL